MTDQEKGITKDVLWGMYQEHVVHGRHHEVQRATVTNLVILLAAGVTTFVTVDKSINSADLPATILLMALGIFGAVFSAQHYERYSKHMDRAKQYRDAIDCILPSIDDALFAKSKKRCVELRCKSSDPKVPLSSGLILALKEAGDHRHSQRKRSRIGSITPGGLHVLWVIMHFVVFGLGLVLTIMAFKYPRSWQ